MTTNNRSEINKFREKIEKVVLPTGLKQRLSDQLESLERSLSSPVYIQEVETTRRYLDWVVSLPWEKRTIDNLDLPRAAEVLNRNHFGMEKIKERILEYIAVLKLTGGTGSDLSSVLCFTGLPGLGKTSVSLSIAQALGRSFIRLPFGGLGDVSQIRGLPRYLPAAEPGQIIKGLRRAASLNPVILLDEIDRVEDAARGVIMGALLELLDPEQNRSFTDYYLDFPFNLGQVLFICTANNTRGIANAVLDRLELIDMPSYTDEQKIAIGKDYLLPKILLASGLGRDQIKIENALWPKIIRPLGYDAGTRTLERTLEGIGRKVARRVVERKGETFNLNETNIKDFLPV